MLHTTPTKRSDDATSPKRVRNRRSRVAGAPSYALAGAVGTFAQSGAVASNNPGDKSRLGTPKREWAVTVSYFF